MHRGPFVCVKSADSKLHPSFGSGRIVRSERGTAMAKPRVRIYTDYKSPYAYVANKRLFELEERYGVELEWLPYTLRIAELMGKVEERTPHFWRKVRYAYAYMDAPLRQRARAHHERAKAHLRCVLRQRRHAVHAASPTVPVLSRHGVSPVLEPRPRDR